MSHLFIIHMLQHFFLKSLMEMENTAKRYTIQGKIFWHYIVKVVHHIGHYYINIKFLFLKYFLTSLKQKTKVLNASELVKI